MRTGVLCDAASQTSSSDGSEKAVFLVLMVIAWRKIRKHKKFFVVFEFDGVVDGGCMEEETEE